MDDVDDLTSLYRTDQRSHTDGSPWVVLNMIASLDGAIAVDGLSGGLGNDADFAVFMTLRRLADVILVGAGTTAAEGYRVPSSDPTITADRIARGQAARPTIALVSRRLTIDLDGPLFAEPDYRPAVVTTIDADAGRVRAIAQVADVIQAGAGAVDLRAAVHQLAARSGPIVLAEGGPTLNGQLAADDVIDEICTTTSPLVVGGESGRMVANGQPHDPRQFTIDRSRVAGGLLFCRYLRER